MTIDIVLATYNGAPYLASQIDSLLAQGYTDWRLLLRDDCSNDTTPLFLEKYAERYPHKISLLPSGERKGAMANFGTLLEQTTAPYVMFCDQDDLWDRDKIALTLAKMHSLEKTMGKETPLLVHTDLRVVDRYLHPIAPSFWRYAHLYPEKTVTLAQLMTQNVVTGCTSLVNRALLQRGLPLPEEAIMHDWWFALVATAVGAVGIVDKDTIAYRQHAHNVLGAKRFCWNGLKTAWKRRKVMAENKRKQAEALKRRLREELSLDQQAIIDTYLALHTLSFWKSRYLTLRHHFFKQGLTRRLASLLFLKQP